MQYKKDEIKERIDVAALAVFAEKGYKGAAISEIGKRAGVSVGNIYRYYRCKDDMFYANVDNHFIEEIKDILKDKIAAMGGKNTLLEGLQDGFWLVNEEAISFMVANRHKIIILFGKSEGTKYEKAKAELVAYILEEVKKSTAKGAAAFETAIQDGFTADIIYKSLMDMILGILEESEDSETVKRSLRAVNAYHLFGITGFLTFTAK